MCSSWARSSGSCSTWILESDYEFESLIKNSLSGPPREALGDVWICGISSMSSWCSEGSSLLGSLLNMSCWSIFSWVTIWYSSTSSSWSCLESILLSLCFSYLFVDFLELPVDLFSDFAPFEFFFYAMNRCFLLFPDLTFWATCASVCSSSPELISFLGASTG